jgi:release factor glutamine methyltransferase
LLDAQVILAHVLEQTRTWIVAHPETNLSPFQTDQLEKFLAQFTAGQPLPYLLGRWDFFGLPFFISPDVLIPRPETELLVENALLWLNSHPNRRRVCDIGTGSGCIAISMAKNVRDIKVIATELSFAALKIARQNVLYHDLTQQVQLVNCHLLQPIKAGFDLICANLPYIPTQRLAELQVSQHEPRLALDGGADGLRLIQSLLQISRRWINPHGLILLEIDFSQGDALLSEARLLFHEASIEVINDYAGLPRLLRIELGSVQ